MQLSWLFVFVAVSESGFRINCRRMLSTVAGIILLITSTAIAADRPSFAVAAAKSAEKFKTDQGGQYGMSFMKSAGKALVSAGKGCMDGGTKIGSYHDIVFLVSATGRIEHIIHDRRSAYGDCVTSHLHMPATVAKPPADLWPIHIRFLHGPMPRENPPDFMVLADDAVATAPGPPDKPVRTIGDEQLDALAKAEAPYIAKGRATYPEAKKRFLAGLPRGESFSVRKLLIDPDGMRQEEVFIEVNAIKNAIVSGHVASELGVVRTFRTGQPISFPESEVLDWTILHPDGREEGNHVGKFIDTYKPER